MVFLAGAMEGTTSFASWAISHLSHSPEWQSRVYEEVKAMDYYDPDDFAGAPNLNRVLEEGLDLLAELDAEGEYWVDRGNCNGTSTSPTVGMLYFLPPSAAGNGGQQADLYRIQTQVGVQRRDQDRKTMAVHVL